MKLNFLSNYGINRNNYEYKSGYDRMSSPNLAPLARDTVSFGALKKSEFTGLNRAIAEKFKAPIEKFNSEEDFQDWAKDEVQKIVKKDFGGRQEETKIQRKAMLKEWYKYVTEENNAYTPAIALLIMRGITAGLKPDEDTIPPVLNKGVLADTIDTLSKELKADGKKQFNFLKQYKTKLQAHYFEDSSTGITTTGWMVIPGKIKAPENFEDNVEKLKTFSHKNWCTKSFKAEPYLSEGDFHIYLENGKPKLGVRFVGDGIEEIQGENNDGKIPQKYFDEMKEHIKSENLALNENAEKEIENAEEVNKQIEKLKSKLGEDAIKNVDAEKILPYFGIETQKDDDGLLIISEYKQPSEEYTFEDFGIDENKLVRNVKVIEGDANFYKTQVQDLHNLHSVGGWADFSYSQIQDLGSLHSIGGSANFSFNQVQDLSSLKSIGGYANFSFSQVKDLSNLQSIDGDANFNNSQVQDLHNLQSIGGDANFNKILVQNLSSLQSIGGYADFRNSQVQDLSSLKSIGGAVNFNFSQVQNLSSLKSIGRYGDFSNSQVRDLGSLQSIGGYGDFRNSQVQNLSNLKSIDGDVYISDSKLTANDFKNIKIKRELVK